MAAHLRSAIAENVVDIPGGEQLMLGASIGVAVIERQADNDAIFAEADRNMYRDKQERRQEGVNRQFASPTSTRWEQRPNRLAT